MDHPLFWLIAFLISGTLNAILLFAIYCDKPPKPTTRNGATADDVSWGPLNLSDENNAWNKMALGISQELRTGVLSPFVGPPAPAAKPNKVTKKRAKVVALKG